VLERRQLFHGQTERFKSDAPRSDGGLLARRPWGWRFAQRCKETRLNQGIANTGAAVEEVGGSQIR
jgi:hypothetical protein